MNTTEQEFQTHDCHLGPEDGCKVCEDYFWSHLAKHNEDEAGLERFLESRVPALKEVSCATCLGTGLVEKTEGYRDSETGIYHVEGTGVYEGCPNCQDHE